VSRVDHLEPDHWRVYDGIDPEDVNFEELSRRLTVGRWTFPGFLLGSLGTSAGIVTLIGVAFGTWGELPPLHGILAAVSVLVVSVPVALSKGRRVREALQAEDVMRVLVLREWSTGQPVLPSTVPWPKHWQEIRTPPPPTDTELRRIRLAKRITKSRIMRWLPRVAIAMIPPGLALMIFAPDPLQDFLFSVGPVLPFLLLAGPFFTWLAVALTAARLEGRIWMLQEYEKVSGRQVLPEDVAKYTAR